MSLETLSYVGRDSRGEPINIQPVTPEEFHEIATAEGYVRLEPLRGDPIAPTREALRFVRFGIANGLETQFVTEDDLWELGYVKLDVDVDELRQKVKDYDDGWGIGNSTIEILMSTARQVLAALDGEAQIHASYCMEGPNHPGECQP